MSVFPLSVSLNQINVHHFSSWKAKKEKKKKEKLRYTCHELSQHQMGARGGNRESGRC